MKKAIKVILGIAALFAAGFGVYYLYKNVIQKDCDDFDDFEDDFDTVDKPEQKTVNREYVSIDITSEDATESDTSSEAASEEAADSEK